MHLANTTFCYTRLSLMARAANFAVENRVNKPHSRMLQGHFLDCKAY